MDEPGLDRAEWETEWAALEPLVVDSPEEALPEVDRLVRSMLVEVGYPLEEGEIERMAVEGIDPDVLATYLAAHDIATRAERGLDVGAENVTEAVRLFRELYEHLLSREINVP
jgi:BioD-like phosphotransacetylase family protein